MVQSQSEELLCVMLPYEEHTQELQGVLRKPGAEQAYGTNEARVLNTSLF